MQACNSNYITCKSKSLTLVAKFRKAHDATPQHDTKTSFSKPQQLWRHLEVPLQFRCIVLKPRRQHVSTHGYTIMEQPVARDLFQSKAAGIMLVEPAEQQQLTLLASYRVQHNPFLSQKLKLKMASVKRDTNCPKRKEMLQRQKKLPVN